MIVVSTLNQGRSFLGKEGALSSVFSGVVWVRGVEVVSEDVYERR